MSKTYESKSCKVCGKPFTPTHHRQTICSDECRKNRNSKPPKYPLFFCVQCGHSFYPNHPKQILCSPKCQQDRKKELALNKRLDKQVDPTEEVWYIKLLKTAINLYKRMENGFKI